ncbi:MAG: ribosomal RNA small subunit methyltransferase A [Bacteroidetes bacterium]|nr:ribosomal RNA small subunit methyltransferase A [Bacteroidota bacterium]
MLHPKKHLGQHFLQDQNIARKIVSSLTLKGYDDLLEIGPGTGFLTRFLLEIPCLSPACRTGRGRQASIRLWCSEIDNEFCDHLAGKFPSLAGKIIRGDFLKIDIKSLFDRNAFALIGNLPYNISTQIFFKVLEYKDRIPEAVFMVQKEVAERVVSINGTKNYGITSVLVQAFYRAEYLFTVSKNVFYPQPEVSSAVIRLSRKEEEFPVGQYLFFEVVKRAFNQRRKMLRNSLEGVIMAKDKDKDKVKEMLHSSLLQKRPEQISVQQFIELTREIQKICYAGDKG